MILNRSRLIEVLDTLRLAAGNKVMEVSFNVKFIVDRDNHSVYLTTTDFHTFILVDFGDVDLSILDDVPQEFLINFDSFYNLVRASTTDTVLIAQDSDTDENYVYIETNGSFMFPLFGNPSQFPIADFSHTPLASWKVDDLLAIWKKVAPVVSKDVTKLSYQGVNYDGNWAASDNRRFAIYSSGDSYDGQSVLIPTVFGDLVERCKEEVSVGVNAAGNMFVLTNPQTGIMAAMRLVDAKFVAYDRLLKGRSEYITVTVPKRAILGTLRRIGCFTDKLFKIGKFTICRNDDGVKIRCEIHNESNQGTEEIEATDFEIADDAPDEYELASFQYQIDNVAAGIDSVDSKDEVRLSFQRDGKLWIDEDKFHYLLSRVTG